MKTIADIQAAKTADLIAFWNEYNEKQITKFSDRKTAESRCEKLLNQLIADGEIDGDKAEEVSEPIADVVKNPKADPMAFWVQAEAKAAALRAGEAVEEVSKDAKKPATARSYASNSAGVAASWNDAEVRAARRTRDGVFVTLNGATTEHKSTREAFRHYRLPDLKHIRFRMKLKESRAETFELNGKKYDFVMREATDQGDTAAPVDGKPTKG